MSSLGTITIDDGVDEYGCVGSPYVSIEYVEKLLSYMDTKDLEYLREVCTLLIERDANNTL
jgi:hypothetical protein